MAIDNPEILNRLQRARTPKEKKLPQPIARMSEKKKAQLGAEKKLFQEDKEFYAEIWSCSPHVCQACNKNLGREPLTLFFHHLLPKDIYDQFRHTPENIMILCPDCHTQAETLLDHAPKVKARRDEVAKLLLG